MCNEFQKSYTKARRAFIEGEFSRLNEMQRKAVMTTEGALLILAGAGSGKTTVLINRIANLMRFGRAADTDEIPDGAREEDIEILKAGGERARALAAFEPVEPWRILAITFTNKAADELKNRLSAMLGDDARDIWASTFHSCCVRILRRDAEKLGITSDFTIYDTADSQSLVKRILRDFDIDEKTFPPKAILSEISRAKDAQVDSAAYFERASITGDIRKKQIGRVYVEYMRRMAAAGALDFDDLILFTVKLLQENEQAREFWQRKFKYIMIDEYQDTNNLQYLFASLLAGGRGNICVVGDDDQSIYKFRGATIENILSFEDQYKNCRTIRLERNYRSTGNILAAANAVIANNTERKGKQLWTEREAGEPITLYTAGDQDEEGQYIAGQMMSAFGRGCAWKDHAILYRMNAQSNTIERALKRNGIPYRIIGGTRFFDRAEVKDVLAYLCVIASPSDDLRLSRIINVPARGIGAKTVETVQELAVRENRPMLEIIADAGNRAELSKSAQRLRLFGIMIDELRTFAAENTPDLLFDELMDKTGYIRALEEKNTVEDSARADNVRELRSSIVGYMKETGDTTLTGFLADVALYTDLDNYDRDADSVVLMTMHAAKGLEFPTVFIVGAEEGVFPGLRAIGEIEEMEEERRLCYVAMTRAMTKLHITCARQRMLFGHTTSNKLSRFIEEIPEEYLEKRGSARAASFERALRQTGYGAPTVRTHDRSEPRRSPVQAPDSSAGEAVLAKFSSGDRIEHTAFGRGVIRSMRPMGNDSLIEIEFDGGTTKKFMLRAAAQHMTKA